jgi:hypothetical protein
MERGIHPSVPFPPARWLLGFWLRSPKAATAEEEKGQTRSWLIKAPLPAGRNKFQNLSGEFFTSNGSNIHYFTCKGRACARVDNIAQQ